MTTPSTSSFKLGDFACSISIRPPTEKIEAPMIRPSIAIAPRVPSVPECDKGLRFSMPMLMTTSRTITSMTAVAGGNDWVPGLRQPHFGHHFASTDTMCLHSRFLQRGMRSVSHRVRLAGKAPTPAFASIGWGPDVRLPTNSRLRGVRSGLRRGLLVRFLPTKPTELREPESHLGGNTAAPAALMRPNHELFTVSCRQTLWLTISRLERGSATGDHNRHRCHSSFQSA